MSIRFSLVPVPSRSLVPLSPSHTVFLSNVPETVSSEGDYAVPVEGFGEAMLRGMGWSEQCPEVGKTNRAVVKPVEPHVRDGRQGLGAVCGNVMNMKRSKKIIQPGEKRKIVEEAVLRPREMRNNVMVEVIDGKHMFLFGRVVTFDLKNVEICLNLNDELAVIPREQIHVIEEKLLSNDHPALLKGKAAANYRKLKLKAEASVVKTNEQQAEIPKKRLAENEGANARTPKIVKKEKELSWIVPGIFVRIINESIKNGDVYNKKGYVEDVVSPFLFTVLLENNQFVENLKESDVETALPKIPGRVKFVRGSWKGEVGQLIEKDSDKNKGVVQIIRLADITECSLDDIAGFV